MTDARRKGDSRGTIILVASIVTGAAIFTLDLLMPLGVAAGVPYVGLVLISLYSSWRHYAIVLAIASTVLTVLGYILSPTFGILWVVITNRLLAVFLIWLTAEFCRRRIRAEEELEKSEQRYQELFAALMEGVGIVDENDRVVFCNPAYARIFEEDSSKEMVGKSLFEYVSSTMEKVIRQQTTIRKKQKSSQYELEIITKKNNPRTILVSVSPRFNPNGEYIGAFGNVVDITETKRLQELESRAGRLETAGTIAGQVAHDFNNLLGPLLAYPNFIRETIQRNPQVDSYLDAIESAAEQMTEINQQLLTLGRRGSFKREPIKLNELVLTVLKSFSPDGASITVETQLSEDIQEIQGGASQIYQALSNLLHNAKDAISERGQILIETKQRHVGEFMGPSGQIPTGDYIILSVKDSGVGIPDQIAQRMFNAFYSTKTADGHSGSGLGLSIVDAVMKDHNAYIDFESQVGEGTAFHLYFPVTIESGGHATDEPVTNSGESVLVVEDDPIQRDVFVALLRQQGYQASSVNSGEQALAFLQENPQDLLLLDMAMPNGINGTETFRSALRINPAQKALLLAGYVEDGELEIALSLGVGGFLQKPVTSERLDLAVRKELDREAPVLV